MQLNSTTPYKGYQIIKQHHFNNTQINVHIILHYSSASLQNQVCSNKQLVYTETRLNQSFMTIQPQSMLSHSENDLICRAISWAHPVRTQPKTTHFSTTVDCLASIITEHVHIWPTIQRILSHMANHAVYSLAVCPSLFLSSLRLVPWPWEGKVSISKINVIYDKMEVCVSWPWQAN